MHYFILVLALLGCSFFGTSAEAQRRHRRRQPSIAALRAITSDRVPAGPTRGYVRGRAVRLVIVRVDNKPVEQHTAEAYHRMQAAAAGAGINLRIVSGFRTMRHQRALYALHRRRQGSLAARPGLSNHQSGHALDLNTSAPGVYAWLAANASRFGFYRTVRSEPWHWEWGTTPPQRSRRRHRRRRR